MNNLLNKLKSPILLQGNETTAYRDPTVVFHDGIFHLFYTLVLSESEDMPFLYTAMSKSSDLQTFSQPKILTPRNQALNFSSPGNVIRIKDEWILCLQTYPRPAGERYGNADARIWIMRSPDLETWSDPEILRVKGNDVEISEMGRMIDPYLLEDKDEPGKWWCFYKQNGVSMSYSYDLENWHFSGSTNSGENVCVLVKNNEYQLFHSPENGIGVMTSTDLKNWTDTGRLITLNQSAWPWAQGRLTAGFVMDCRNVAGIGKYLMFFHGTGPEDESVIFDTRACIGIAWSDDLGNWNTVVP